MGGEHVIFRRGLHWKNYIYPGGVLLLCLVGLVTVVSAPGFSFSGVAYGVTMMDAGSLLAAGEVMAFAAGILWAVFAAICRASVGYFITNHRVIKMWGFMNLHSIEVQLHRCKGVHVSEKFYERVFGTGDVTIYTSGMNVYFDDVPSVKEFARVLQNHVTAIQIEDKAFLL